tara:strand:- start:299 stop:901 length:603 start_codon:yes stop_codon:yes gene_type:complete
MAMEDEYNEFETFVPGQSLAGEPMGSYPWETPADFPDPDEFYLFTQDKLMNDEGNLMNVVRLLEMEIPVETIVDVVLMNSFMIGQISADTAIVSKEPITELILLIAQEAGIDAVRKDVEGESKQSVLLDQALMAIAQEEEGAEGGEEAMSMEDDAMSPMGMMAPPDDMDMMSMGDDMDMMDMEELPQEMEEEEEDELLEI